MQFFSTRDQNRKVTSSEAIAQGLSNEGGLLDRPCAIASEEVTLRFWSLVLKNCIVVAPFSPWNAENTFLLLWQRRSLPVHFPPGRLLYARKAPLIICTIQRPLSRGNTSATSNRTGASLRPFCCR